MAELSENWRPQQLLQSFCSQAASVTVLRLSRPAAAGAAGAAAADATAADAAAADAAAADAAAADAAAAEPLDVLLSLYGDSLCCALLPESARAAAAADAAAAAAASPEAAAPAAAAAAAAAELPPYLLQQFWGPLRLTDEAVDEPVAAFAACPLVPSNSSSSKSSSSSNSSSSKKKRKEAREASPSLALVLTCGASGLLRLLLLSLKPLQQQQQEQEPQQQQRQQQQDPALLIAAQRLGSSSGSSSSSSTDGSFQPWARLQQLQKWKGASSVARVVAISEPLAVFDSAAAAAAAAAAASGAAAAAARPVRVAAVGCIGGEVELLLLQQTAAIPCCSLKHPASITTLKFHSTRALLAVGAADGLLRVYDVSFAAAAVAAAAAAGSAAAIAAEHVPYITLSDHMSSITALSFLSAAAAAALQQQQQQQRRHKAEQEARKKPTAAAAAAAAFDDCLVSAAKDSLINVWALRPLSHTAGLLLLPQQQQQQQHDEQQLVQQIKKSALQLQKRLQFHQQQQQQRQLLLLQLPTIETITALAADAAAPLLLSGGSEGLVKLWDLRKRQPVKVMTTTTTASAGASSASEEDLGAFIRTLLLLPASSSSSSSNSSSSSSSSSTLLIAQDSGVISLVSPLPGLAALSAEGGAAAAGRTAAAAAAAASSSKTTAVCLLGRLDGTFACRWLPQPPNGCCCSFCCCSKRRQKHYSSSYPGRLLVLTGDSCCWQLDLSQGSFGAFPVAADLLKFGQVEQQQQQQQQQQTQAAAVSCCDVSKNGCWIVTGGRDGSLRVWHSEANRLLLLIEKAHEGCVTAVAFQRKNWPKASPVVRQPPQQQQQQQEQQQQQQQLDCLCDCRGLSPAAPQTLSFISCCDKNSLRLWRVEVPAEFILGSSSSSSSSSSKPQVSYECISTIVAHKKEINDLKFAPNDSLVGTASADKTCLLLLLPTLAAAGELRGHRRGVQEIQFLKREKAAATASLDATVRLWSLASFACLKTLQGDSGFLSLRLLPLETQLLAFAADGSARLFNCRTADCAAQLPPLHTDKVWALDLWGCAAASAGADGRLCVWRDVTREAAAAKKLEALEEQQQLAAVQQLEAMGRSSDVLRLLLRLRKKHLAAAFIKRQLVAAASRCLDTRVPAALARRADARGLLQLLLEQQQLQQLQQQQQRELQRTLQQQLQRQQQQPPQGACEETDWGALVGCLDTSEAKTLLGFAAEWAAAPATAAAAHGLLHLLLRSRSLDALLSSSSSSSNSKELWGKRLSIGGKPAAEVLQVLLLLANRQERRVAALLEKSYLLDLLLPTASVVQQELQQLLQPLQQQHQQRKQKETAAAAAAAAEEPGGKKKKRKLQQQQEQQQQEQQQQQQQEQQQQQQQLLLLSAEALEPHFAAEFTQRCLYGELQL
ncbi:WD-40 repeat protein, putative [Eimeria tenella]|uniref:WD-40 repeat protein, putative n=1 Tax=Eimeria tenella TaxID=5802 RepID=U6KJN9_EIMTE|nr:WD-40 repeat protein, putative [Eimeria tenella]CDJ37016.1 WD-40 repeat protein, putative [Eimeria tenella]|eukprot:XP_013227854.1 WD-40 repeat protein, putative [Eimeria tenella]